MENLGVHDFYRRHIFLSVFLLGVRYPRGIHHHALDAVLGQRGRFADPGGLLLRLTGAWAVFLGMFFLTFVGMTIGFDIYFRITGRKYDGLLGQYRREKEEKGE